MSTELVRIRFKDDTVKTVLPHIARNLKLQKQYGFTVMGIEKPEAPAPEPIKQESQDVTDVTGLSGEAWVEELVSIKGIGQKTAEDVASVFPNHEELIKAISGGETLPFAANHNKILISHYAPE